MLGSFAGFLERAGRMRWKARLTGMAFVTFDTSATMLGVRSSLANTVSTHSPTTIASSEGSGHHSWNPSRIRSMTKDIPTQLESSFFRGGGSLIGWIERHGHYSEPSQTWKALILYVMRARLLGYSVINSPIVTIQQPIKLLLDECSHYGHLRGYFQFAEWTISLFQFYQHGSPKSHRLHLSPRSVKSLLLNQRVAQRWESLIGNSIASITSSSGLASAQRGAKLSIIYFFS